MPCFWCYLLNNTASFLKIVVLSQFGQGLYYLLPGQGQWLQWYAGQKVMTLFDGNSGQLLYSYTFCVNGPGQYNVSGGGPAPYVVESCVAQSNPPNVPEPYTAA
jgi:hypothetical protein